MILHIIHATKHPLAPLPLTRNLRIMLGLMPRAVLLVREPGLDGLRAAVIATKEVLVVPVEVLAQVAGPGEACLGGASGMCAAPGAVGVADAVSGEGGRVVVDVDVGGFRAEAAWTGGFWDWLLLLFLLLLLRLLVWVVVVVLLLLLLLMMVVAARYGIHVAAGADVRRRRHHPVNLGPSRICTHV